jgi:hypothetical protein
MAKNVQLYLKLQHYPTRIEGPSPSTPSSMAGRLLNFDPKQAKLTTWFSSPIEEWNGRQTEAPK